MSSRRYHPDQKNEIYNFRAVPDLQISKKLELLMMYMFFLFAFRYCFVVNDVFWGFGGLSSIPSGSEK